MSNELRDAADIVAETRRLLAAARDAGVPLRALGGAAIALTCPSAHRPPLRRSYGDIDLIAGSRDRAAIVAAFETAGLSPDTGFNALHGADRVWFWEPVRGYKVEVFLDRVSMCHTLELADRIELGDAALAPADLLLLKLQVVAMTDKDLQDAIALLCDHEIAPDGIDADYVGELLASDWGWWRTATESLDKIAQRIAAIAADAPPDVPGLAAAAERAETLRVAIDAHSKSRRWRLRARVGERMRWYEEPEEVAG